VVKVATPEIVFVVPPTRLIAPAVTSVKVVLVDVRVSTVPVVTEPVVTVAFVAVKVATPDTVFVDPPTRLIAPAVTFVR
jgi:hypothetical protein